MCREIGIEVAGVLNGADLAKLDDKALAAAIPGTTVFARVSPDQKSRIIVVARSMGKDVAFMGDGVNDAVAIHHADVGISVDSGTDVAKDAADVVLLEKDLGVLATGVMEGRRIFGNTMRSSTGHMTHGQRCPAHSHPSPVRSQPPIPGQCGGSTAGRPRLRFTCSPDRAGGFCDQGFRRERAAPQRRR